MTFCMYNIHTYMYVHYLIYLVFVSPSLLVRRCGYVLMPDCMFKDGYDPCSYKQFMSTPVSIHCTVSRVLRGAIQNSISYSIVTQ